MTNSLLVINLNKFLHTRGLAKSANSDYNLKYIIRFALVNSIRIYKKNSWNHCRLDVINFSIHGGLYWKLTAAANEPQQWGAPKGPPRVGALFSLVLAANFVQKPLWIEKLITSQRQRCQAKFLLILIEFTKANLVMYFKLGWPISAASTHLAPWEREPEGEGVTIPCSLSGLEGQFHRHFPIPLKN